MARVTVRFYAGAAQAAGVSSDRCDAATLGELIDHISVDYGSSLQRVLSASSLLVDGVSYRCSDSDYRTVRLADGSTVDVLPPFAGG